jgi:hypothetical protein
MAAVPQSKSGTAAIKTAPPKETARITVKPSLPGTARVTPAAPTVKAATPAVAAGDPAAMKAGAAAVKVAPKASGAVPVPAYVPEEEKSTVVSTAVAGVLALVTWGTAGILGYYVFMGQ